MSQSDDKPPIAAVFQVVFDQKVGYTIAWKRSLDDIDLEGVEFKSLPSGLHAIKEDLVYFIHGANAGVSVFIQKEADASQRNASFVAVGALVLVEAGQLGQSWVHAEELRRLAKETVGRTTETGALERFWEQHRVDNKASPNSNGSTTAKRKRAASETTLAGFNAESRWPLDHPGLHAPIMLETFGPLLFPLYRAALARQRVLLLGSPSVQKNSNTVFLTSILSTISKSFADSLLEETKPLHQTSPLFSVGVHDIPDLGSRKQGTGGWIATSTDEILDDKKDLYDLLVRLPSQQPASSSRAWPELKTSSGRIVKASQRDLRRWTLLQRELSRLRRQTISRFADDESSSPVAAATASESEYENDQRPLLARSTSTTTNDSISKDDTTAAVEPPSWSAMAYRTLMWWASGGDVNAWENEEAAADEELLFDLSGLSHSSPAGDRRSTAQGNVESEYARAVATVLIAYFRRVTEGILRGLMSLVDATEEGGDEAIVVSGEDLKGMGLDSWSEADKIFVKEMVKTWFAREAVVEEGGVRVCGVRMY